MITAQLIKSPLKNKKYRAVFFKDGDKFKKSDFGGVKSNGIPYDDYITHKDKKRKNNYISRHHNEKYLWENDPYAPATLSRFVLWEYENINKAWEKYKKRFNIK